MLRIPRAAVLHELAHDLLRDDGPRVIHVLFSDEGGELVPDIAALGLGDTAETVAAALTVFDWSAFAQALFAVDPGEQRPELTEKARCELRGVLVGVAARAGARPGRSG